MKKSYRIKSKKRFSAFLVFVILLLATGTSFAVDTETAQGLSEAPYAEVLVEAGDTLWNLAKQYGPEQNDPRDVVDTICELNQITPEDLQAGQTILIPIS
ncbi:MAG: LysM peptidoglycan-binding domain-containing protein [Eubacteriales bacterium]|nr:LysM peptidoglycan-binding domain-containing protein [Eubacteriales bacterium]MDD3349429.1 LysM peptidoglycan-binding domain-containing protein [Eubacteriales bacterium]